MKNFTKLPNNYAEILKIDLQKHKKQALIVNVFALLLAIPMAVIAAIVVPITTFFDLSVGLVAYFFKLIVFMVGVIAYIFLHELVHGICMKYFSKTKVHYGFTGLYAYAGSDAYFNKKSYIIIALAPVVFWGIVLLIINCFVDISWFWCVYFIQICNISGAAGDLYVTYKMSKMPKDILIKDTGVSMTVYSNI